MSTHIVVGGGIAGLLAAKLFLARGLPTVIIERDSQLGGLLKSIQTPSGHEFNCGVHYALNTGVQGVDDLLLGGMNDQDWFKFEDSLPEGNFFSGKLNRESGCIDTRLLSDRDYAQGVVELLSAGYGNAKPKTMYDSLIRDFGATFTEKVYRPLVNKFAGCEPEELDPEGHEIFGNSRLIILPGEATIELKKLASFDRRIAYTDRKDGSSKMLKYFPKTGAIGRWIEDLSKSIRDGGGRIITGQTVETVLWEGDEITAVKLDDGEEISCAHLCWAVPPVMLGKAASLEVPSVRPRFRQLALANFVFDKAPTPELHWITVYDANYHSFRITLYSNIGDSADIGQGHRVTVEVLSDDFSNEEDLLSQIGQELIDMNICSADASISWQGLEVIKNALPVRLKNTNLVDEQVSILTGQLSNLFIIGRGVNGHFHQNVILLDAYEKIQNRLN